MIVTLAHIQEAIARTVEARERILPLRSTDAIITAIAQAASHWLAPNSHWRARAIAEAPGPTRFSEAMIHEAIQLTFGSLTFEALGELLDRELGNRRVLDEFCLRGRVQSRAHGPRLITHILAGNVPSPGIISLCRGLLLKSANLVRTSTHDPIFPVLFAESLREVDPELADCLAVLSWPREETALTQAALATANAVLAYGDDTTIGQLRRLTPEGAQFLGYGSKVSFGVIAKEAMTEENLPALAEAAAFDVSIYDQQGCLSPHVIYVEERGPLGPRKFAEALAQAMDVYQQRVPRGQLTIEEAAAVSQLRQAYEFRGATDRRVAVWASPTPNEWTVIYEDDPSFSPSCLNRTVYVKPTDSFKRVLDSVQRYSDRISTVGVTPLNERAMTFAADLAKMGVHRVCQLGQMQRPPLSWHHDGRPNLADLVRWTDVG
ncbi:MAG: acyl-CoA reductase [Verrucomicrobiota bacterium]